MKRLPILLWLGLLAVGADPGAAQVPDWMERWLFNADERTRRGIEAAGAERPEAALEPLDTASRLSGSDALGQFNSGTGRLALDSREALLHLQVAANEAGPDLAAQAHYNLGNGLLSAGNLPEAIEAYKESLRHDPTSDDAKFNLELAQKLLEEQPKNEDPNQQNPNQDQQNQDQQEQENQDQQNQDQEQDPQDQENQDEQNQDQQNQDQQNQEQQQDQQEQQDQQQQEQQQQNQDPSSPDDSQDDGQPQDQQRQQQESPLPQFQDLPDMTAEEAAAILEAIENLEREQRQQEALEAAAENAGRKKDW